MNVKICPKCNAKWIDGKLYWSTGAAAREEDLAGLVCDKLSDGSCINPLKGTNHDGDTWEKRLEQMEILDKQLNPNED